MNTFLSQIRKDKRLSQNALANLSNISIRNIQYYEQKVMNIDGAKISTLLSLSLALSCRISDIIENKELKKQLADNGY